MRSRAAVVGMSVLLALYLALVAWRAVQLMASGVPVGVVLGVALIILPVLAALLVARELQFGVLTQRLVTRLAREGGLPEETLPVRASGRPERAAADAEFPRWRAETEAAPDDWRTWVRLGLAYDASGDRRRARAALREAIRRSR